jgi:hypothetical protein
LKRIYCLLFFLILLLALAIPNPAASQTETVATVRISPPVVALAPGEGATIEVWVDDVESLFAFDLEIIFDPDYLLVKDANLDEVDIQVHQGDFLETQAGKYQIVKNQADNQLGTIKFEMTQWGQETPSKSGSGILIYFEIRAKERLVATALEISSVLLSDRDGIEIGSTVEQGTVRIIGAADDAYQIPVNETLTVSAPGVLVNDMAPEGLMFTVAQLENDFDGEGVLNWHGNGGFNYTPPEFWTGTVSFTYLACIEEGACYGPATVTLEVNAKDTGENHVYLPLILY